MNRIVLVGNGFDLAPGLPTSYKNFNDWYWERVMRELMWCHSETLDTPLCKIKLDKVTIHTWHSWSYDIGLIHGRKTLLEAKEYLFQHKGNYIWEMHPLFEQIHSSLDDCNWVYIENEYYKLLVSYTNDESGLSSPEILNAELSIIRALLIEYLELVQNQGQSSALTNDSLRELILGPIRGRDISISSKQSWIDFVHYKYRTYIEDYPSFVEGLDSYKSKIGDVKLFNDKYAEQIEHMGIDSISDCDIPDDLARPEKILFLNFNYTDWSDQYIPDDDSRFFINHIHGSLSNPESIIFGYGDELDKNYEGLKNLNNNEYLCNMKSTKYLEADNYRKLLSFIDSAPFQIYIMGHSCGNSDRTLLNTLFEHENCVSIKPFFHRKDNSSDNYLDIVQNISRNFTDMKKMRDRVVNKTYCEPLPQLKKVVEDNK